MESEVVANAERWNSSYGFWSDELAHYKEYWQNRPTHARMHMKTELALANEVALTLNILPAGAGYIKLNTIEIDNPNWTGIYFKGVPVTIEAVANPGFSFATWNSSVLPLSNSSDAKISDFDLTANNVFTANFTGSAQVPQITISEINYHSPADFDTHDWVELHNFGTETVDLSNWYLKDLKLYNKFIIPQGTTLAPDNRLVIAQNKDTFALVHKTLAVIGSLGFNFNNTGETIYLFNNRNVMVQKVAYSDLSPWASFADGLGGTLELETSGEDINDPNNWQSACFGGSPTLGYDPSCPQKFTEVWGSSTTTNTVLVYPNPAQNRVRVEIGNQKIEKIECYDLSGMLLEESNSDWFDISGLNKGVYIVKILSEGNTYSSKLVKE